jgi:hypothetical protein
MRSLITPTNVIDVMKCTLNKRETKRMDVDTVGGY